MMWLMILIAVHINNPKDIPGRVELQLPSQQICEQTLTTMKWQLKFENFKVVGECRKQY
jgi:hypothetical protein